ncbi:uncharacterized protein [Littorina saxatilis]|uniref:uncharacterized protein n=1 Tax=Littorina saxatilis TaxID=31220 RepID=UPI0038B52A42
MITQTPQENGNSLGMATQTLQVNGNSLGMATQAPQENGNSLGMATQTPQENGNSLGMATQTPQENGNSLGMATQTTTSSQNSTIGDNSELSSRRINTTSMNTPETMELAGTQTTASKDAMAPKNNTATVTAASPEEIPNARVTSGISTQKRATFEDMVSTTIVDANTVLQLVTSEPRKAGSKATSPFSNCKCTTANDSVTSSTLIPGAIEFDLRVNVTSLSRWRRRRVSAPDHRMSARAIGWSGVVFVVAVCAVMVVSDVTKLIMGISEKVGARELQHSGDI